jgi:enoyl-CoA hydratase/carnithine racemase
MQEPVEPSPTLVTFEKQASVARLRLNRPDKLNPLDWDTVRALADRIAQVEADEDVLVVVITGAGRAFSAGGDLDGYLRLYRDPRAFRRFLDDFHDTLSAIERSRCIYIAAINGHCVAGGLEVALACDIVVAAEQAEIADGHIIFGQLPGAGGSQRLARTIGALRAKDLILTGRTIDGREAERIGLASRAVPQDQLADAVAALSADLLKASPLGLKGGKHLVNTGMQRPLDEALLMEIEYVHAYATQSEDATEGLRAFRDKRPPRFCGR